jgi:galactoside O-acetyltransferase
MDLGKRDASMAGRRRRGLMGDYDYTQLSRCGENVRIASSVVIKYPELVRIGSHVAIDDFCYITTSLEVGDYVHIGPFCSIVGGKGAQCILRDFAGLAAGCRIICASDDYLGSGLTNPMVPVPFRAQVHFGNVVIEKHAVLGTNCVVHPGVTIGEGTALGSCSLATKTLDPWRVYVGIPARAVKVRERAKILEMELSLRRERG